jgi:secondary thiamine-phosphate synthase enzyme
MNRTAIDLETSAAEELIDITSRVEEAVGVSGVRNGVCFVFVPHTTAGLTINENADPSVRDDILLALKHMVPASLPFAHAEGNSRAHVKASLVGSSVMVLVEKGKLCLGTWQGIFFCEFDGPRRRRIWVTVLAGAAS